MEKQVALITPRKDEEQWLKYRPEEYIPAMRVSEAWSLQVAAGFITNYLIPKLPMEAREDAAQIAHAFSEISFARMEYHQLPEYDPHEESVLVGAMFNTLSKVWQGDEVDDVTVTAAVKYIAGCLAYLDERTRIAGFIHPLRLESRVLRGDS